MPKTLGVILLLALCAYAGACLVLFFSQRGLIYFPPPAAAVPAPDTSVLAVPGASLVVSGRPVEGPKALVYLGGNAEDVSASLPLLGQAFPERSLYLLHYRGYAGSTGRPTESALVADALALFDQVAGKHHDIVVLGRSLGAAVAVQVAAQRPVSKLVLVTPFDSLRGLAARQFPYFPVRWLLRDSYDSWRYAPQVKAPTLVVAASDDEIIPGRSTRRLLAHFPDGVASMRVLKETGHNSISDSPDYLRALQWAR